MRRGCSYKKAQFIKPFILSIIGRVLFDAIDLFSCR